jgi:hypothetical protein
MKPEIVKEDWFDAVDLRSSRGEDDHCDGEDRENTQRMRVSPSRAVSDA